MRSHGIGTVSDIADYYRINVADTRPRSADLVEAGEVVPVRVRGWTEPAYLHRDARMPRKVAGSALLCPFDPLIWERAAPSGCSTSATGSRSTRRSRKRQFGYYVFPLLIGERLVGRFDLKADRATRDCWCRRPGRRRADPVDAAAAAAVEFARMAHWLALDEIVVMPRGDLWQTLAARPGMTAGSLPG